MARCTVPAEPDVNPTTHLTMPLKLRQNPHRNVLLAAVLLSSWLMLMMTGYAFGGWIHLVLLTALIIFPWRGQETPPGKLQAETRGKVQGSSSEDSSSNATPDDTTHRI